MILRCGDWAVKNRRIWRLGVLFLTVFLIGLSEARAQGTTSISILTVSKPPPPAVASDPPQGLIFKLPADMSASSITFDSSGGDSSGGDSSGGPQSLEYLRLDARGDAYITFDDGPVASAPGGIMVVDDLLNRERFDPSRDRLISGAATRLVEPKDLVVMDDLGLLIVADFAEAKVAVFDLQASGDAPPRFLTTELGTTSAGEPRRPWGLAFDTAADRLFVGGTDGTVLVFDNYLVNRGERGPERVITPTLDGEQVSANIHDLVYLAEQDVLVATDVGAATTADQTGFDTDGKVLLLENASRVDGDTEVKAALAGPSTLLGNPVGAAFDGADLFIAEKTKDIVLRFDDVLSLSGTVDVAPTGAVTVAQPEAVALINGAP